MNMGLVMKRIIELEEVPLVQHFENGIWETVYRVRGFNNIVLCKSDIDKLEPYKEQNVEKGWEIARKILTPKHYGGYSIDEIREIFGDIVSPEEVFDLPLSEVLSKIREYEVKKKELNIGDEVSTELYGHDRTAIVRKVDNIHSYAWVFGKDFSEQCPIDKLVKTGKSYPEVAKAINELR